MAIKDRDIRDALETLDTEIENLEAQIKEKDEEIAKLENKVEELETQREFQDERIKELEEALAEAYLTSETDDGVQREDVELPPGCGTNVLDSTDNKATD